MKGFFLIIPFFLLITASNAQNNSLDYYVNQAIQNSPLLRDYQNQKLIAQYDSLLIRAAYKPQVTGSSINSYAPVINGYGYDQAITNGGNFNALIGVNKALLNKKVVRVQFDSLQLQNQFLDNSYRISEQDLKKTVIAQYITAYGSLLQLNFNTELSALLSKEEVILKKATEKNVYRQVDYLAFLVTLKQQNLSLKQLTIQYKNDLATLNYLSGITDTAVIDLQYPDIRSMQLPDLATSPFLKKFEIDSLKLSNRKNLLDMSYKPKFNVFADAGFNSTLAYQAYKNFGTSFGFSVVIPIYDGKQKKLQYSKLAIEESTRLNYRSFFIAQYKQQIAQLNQQLQATEELINDINAELKYAQALIDTNGKLLETGEVKITDYILALNNFLNAQNLLKQNNISRLQLINQINYWNR